MLICRNLLIYLTPELQEKLLPLFHYSLNPGGILFLGSAETVSAHTDLFAPLHLKSRLFRRRETALAAEPLAFPASFVHALPEDPKQSTILKPAANLQSLADQLLLQHFSPPAVLVNDKRDILYINGRTGKYLEPAAGKATWSRISGSFAKMNVVVVIAVIWWLLNLFGIISQFPHVNVVR